MDRSAPFMHDIVVTKEGVTKLDLLYSILKRLSILLPMNSLKANCLAME